MPGITDNSQINKSKNSVIAYDEQNKKDGPNNLQINLAEDKSISKIPNVIHLIDPPLDNHTLLVTDNKTTLTFFFIILCHFIRFLGFVRDVRIVI